MENKSRAKRVITNTFKEPGPLGYNTQNPIKNSPVSNTEEPDGVEAFIDCPDFDEDGTEEIKKYEEQAKEFLKVTAYSRLEKLAKSNKKAEEKLKKYNSLEDQKQEIIEQQETILKEYMGK